MGMRKTSTCRATAGRIRYNMQPFHVLILAHRLSTQFPEPHDGSLGFAVVAKAVLVRCICGITGTQVRFNLVSQFRSHSFLTERAGSMKHVSPPAFTEGTTPPPATKSRAIANV